METEVTMSIDAVADREPGIHRGTFVDSWDLRRGGLSLIFVTFVLVTVLGGCRRAKQTAHGRRVLFALQPVSVTGVWLQGKDRTVWLTKRNRAWYVGSGMGFPANSQMVLGMIMRWARLESRKVLLSPTSKVRRKLGLDHPCLIARFGQGPRASIEVRVGCSSGKDLAMTVSGGKDVHLVRDQLDGLGLRAASSYRSRVVSALPSNEVVRFVVKSHGSSVPVDVRRGPSGEWALVTAAQGALAADGDKVWAFLHRIDAVLWSDVPKTGASSATGTEIIELWNRDKGPAVERIVLGGACSGGVQAVRTGLFPASGCVAQAVATHLTVRSMDLLDKRLLPMDPADVRRVVWPGVFRVERTASQWIGVVGTNSFPCDAERVLGFVKAMASTRALRVVAVSDHDRTERCVRIESSQHHAMPICLRRGPDGFLVRRGDEPIELVVSKSSTGLFVPSPSTFRSRLLVSVPLSQIDVLTVRRSRTVERIRRSSSGAFVMAVPVPGRPDPQTLEEFGQILSHLSAKAFLDKAPSWFHPDVTLSIVLPDLTRRLAEVKTFEGFLSLLSQSLWPAVLNFHLSVARHDKICVGRLWNLTFRLTERTCRTLYQPLAPRRLLPSVLVESVRGLTICRNGTCRRFRRDQGQWRKVSGGKGGQPSSVNQAAISDRVAAVVSLRAGSVLDYRKAPKSSQTRICLERSIPDQIRGIAGARRLARPCILFGLAPGSDADGRSVWVQGRSVRYALTDSQVRRLMASLK